MIVARKPRVRVFAPATVSNLGPGFDVLGLALHRPGDVVEVEVSDRPGVDLAGVTGEGGALPRDAARNAASVAAAEVLRHAAADGGAAGLRVWLEKGMPLSSGLGSSGASAAAGAVAANEALGRPIAAEALVQCAMSGERAACGAAHADNVAPAVLGGIVLIRSYDPLDLVRLPVPDGLFVVVVHPHCEVSTSEARAKLAGRAFALSDIVANAGNLGAFVAALYRGRPGAGWPGHRRPHRGARPRRDDPRLRRGQVRGAGRRSPRLRHLGIGAVDVRALRQRRHRGAHRARHAAGVQGRRLARQRGVDRPRQPRRRARPAMTCD